jgi:hypothetical protein
VVSVMIACLTAMQKLKSNFLHAYFDSSMHVYQSASIQLRRYLFGFIFNCFPDTEHFPREIPLLSHYSPEDLKTFQLDVLQGLFSFDF